MGALSWDTANHLTVPRLDQDCQEELTSGPRTLPNGQRISGERRAEGDERVRCMRVLGDAFSQHCWTQAGATPTLSNCP